MSNDSKDELTLRIGEKLTAARIESGYTPVSYTHLRAHET